MCLVESFIRTVGLLISLSVIINPQEVSREGGDNNNSFDKNGEGASEELFAVRLRTIDVPGADFIRVYGIKINVTDSLRNNHTIVKFMGIPYAESPTEKLRFQV